MKKHLLPVVFLLYILPLPAQAEKPLSVSISPSVGHSFGETEYIMNITTAVADDNGDVIVDQYGDVVLFQLKSQLEYPLDVVMGGVNIGLAPTHDPTLWSIKAGVFTSINDPGGSMKDHDWTGVVGYIDLTKWSYTESEARNTSLLLKLEATRRIMSPGRTQVSALLGFRYHRIEQDLFGVDGWQRAFDYETGDFSDAYYFDGLEDTQVLYYEVKYLLPQAGLALNAGLFPRLALSAKTAVAYVYFKDVDDHPLRLKLSKADGTGAGFIGSLGARYDVGGAMAGSHSYIDIFAEYTTLSANGDQTQEWYGDDPISLDVDETGLVVSGIPHEVNSSWYHIGINLGLTF